VTDGDGRGRAEAEGEVSDLGSDTAAPTASPTPVLVGSGDAGTRAQVALTLGADRFEVVEVADTESAIRAIVADLPLLLILDAELPGAGALAIARTIRAQPETAGVRTLLLVQRGDDAAAEAPGVDATLAVPFTAFALLGKVEALLPG
jgi:DNA-binding response OmpR family regulator